MSLGKNQWSFFLVKGLWMKKKLEKSAIFKMKKTKFFVILKLRVGTYYLLTWTINVLFCDSIVSMPIWMMASMFRYLCKSPMVFPRLKFSTSSSVGNFGKPNLLSNSYRSFNPIFSSVAAIKICVLCRYYESPKETYRRQWRIDVLSLECVNPDSEKSVLATIILGNLEISAHRHLHLPLSKHDRYKSRDFLYADELLVSSITSRTEWIIRLSLSSPSSNHELYRLPSPSGRSSLNLPHA